MINDVYAAINLKAFTNKITLDAREEFLFVVTEDACNKQAVPAGDDDDDNNLEEKVDGVTEEVAAIKLTMLEIKESFAEMNSKLDKALGGAKK